MMAYGIDVASIMVTITIKEGSVMERKGVLSAMQQVYQTIKLPLWSVVLAAILFFYQANIIKIFLPSYGGTIQKIVDLILVAAIFIASFSLVVRMINLVIGKLQAYVLNQDKTLVSFILPFIDNSAKVIAFLWLLYLFIPYFNISPQYENDLAKFVNIVTIVALSFVVIRMIAGYEKKILDYYSKDLGSNLRARQIYTQVHVLRQIAISAVLIITLAAVLMVFESMREVGVSLLASAGLVSAIIGFSAQKSLGNVTACLQLAFTQIVKIGDDVIVENEFGKVEEITLTYVIIKLWDLRRLVIPVNYLNEKPFQNLTRNSSQLVGTTFLYVDYSFPVDAARTEFNRVLEESKIWDGKVGVLHVSNSTNNAIELRLLASASDSARLWELRCEIREKMINYIVKNYPQSLPKIRAENPLMQ